MAQIEKDLNPDVTIGLQLPLKHDNEFGFFKRTKTFLEQTKTNISNLLLTRKGERLANPEFGCDVHNFIFEQISGDFENKVEESILEAMATYLPQVVVENINTTPGGENGSVHVVNLSFSIATDQTMSEELTLEFPAEGY